MQTPVSTLTSILVRWGLIGLALTPLTAHAECLSTEGFRVDSAERVAELQDVCEITGGIGIFTEGIEQITLPNVEYIKTLNIEAIGLKAIAFPKLKRVDYLYISGGHLEVAEFPKLQSALRVYVQSRRLKYLNFPALGRVSVLSIISNPSLEFVFADELYNVRELRLENNPLLNPATTSVLNGVTQVISQEEQQLIAQAEADAREYKRMLIEQRMNQPPPPPTGHPTTFDSFGLMSPANYYRYYPDKYWNYWNTIGSWGYTRYLFLL